MWPFIIIIIITTVFIILVRICTMYACGCVYIHAEAKGRCQLFPSVILQFIF